MYVPAVEDLSRRCMFVDSHFGKLAVGSVDAVQNHLSTESRLPKEPFAHFIVYLIIYSGSSFAEERRMGSFSIHPVALRV